ncbi:hypothetical protein jhhlp_005316 [Lomentospora prolificans]|uniref:DUF7704 domain-containing protein n=1 Tax=Lomentospora prolificans TaxID=41688 RepID=A0A2N3N7L2_9PEZI|nr:hypothetical protein jhhlp_005316 [Lomentospora prolificans]
MSTFYRVWFIWVDPLSLVPTVYGVIFNRGHLMDALIPSSMSVADPNHAFLFHQLAALYAFLAIVLAGVLRATPDVRVWKTVIGGVLVVDVAILASLYVSLEHQNRLALRNWWVQEWGNLIYTGGVAILRSLFLAGVGVRKGARGKKNVQSLTAQGL